MQDYDFFYATGGKVKNTSLNPVSTTVQPSERVVQNILNFARSTQRLNVENKRIKLYLN